MSTFQRQTLITSNIFLCHFHFHAFCTNYRHINLITIYFAIPLGEHYLSLTWNIIMIWGLAWDRLTEAVKAPSQVIIWMELLDNPLSACFFLRDIYFNQIQSPFLFSPTIRMKTTNYRTLWWWLVSNGKVYVSIWATWILLT